MALRASTLMANQAGWTGCKEMGMILDPKQLIPAPHALTGLSRRLRSLRTEAESKVQE